MSKHKGTDFQFPADFGFSGSAGKTMVRAYARGGPVRVETPAQHREEMRAIKAVGSKLDKHIATPMGKAHRGK